MIGVGLVFIVWEDMRGAYLQQTISLFELVVDGLILLVLLIKFVAIVSKQDLGICNTSGRLLLYTVGEVLLLQALATIDIYDWAMNISAFMVSVASSYCLIARSLTIR
jgi:hypothetical protein